ncbi:unnamed protein product [Amoebophrya sp. A25]|nr:unnamed protein product [Amoebophrya sp. A25]|eukprot:GSA25T00004330001.1
MNIRNLENHKEKPVYFVEVIHTPAYLSLHRKYRSCSCYLLVFFPHVTSLQSSHASRSKDSTRAPVPGQKIPNSNIIFIDSTIIFLRAWYGRKILVKTTAVHLQG